MTQEAGISFLIARVGSLLLRVQNWKVGHGFCRQEMTVARARMKAVDVQRIWATLEGLQGRAS